MGETDPTAPIRLKRIENQIASLTRSVNTIQRSMADLEKKITDGDNEAVRENVETLTTLIDGNERLGVKGFRAELKETKSLVQELVNQRNMIKWVLIGVGATGVTNAGALVALILKAIGGP